MYSSLRRDFNYQYSKELVGNANMFLHFLKMVQHAKGQQGISASLVIISYYVFIIMQDCVNNSDK